MGVGHEGVVLVLGQVLVSGLGEVCLLAEHACPILLCPHPHSLFGLDMHQVGGVWGLCREGVRLPVEVDVQLCRRRVGACAFHALGNYLRPFD